MAKTIRVTPEKLEEAAQKIEGLANDYQRLYEEFYGKTGEMASTWSGKDNLAFIDQIDGFKDDFAKMKAKMDEYVNYLRSTASAYRTTQDNVTSKARTLTN